MPLDGENGAKDGSHEFDAKPRKARMPGQTTIAARHSHRAWFGNLVLISTSIVCGLLLSEVFVRIAAPQDLKGQLYEFAPRGYKVLRSDGSALQTHNGAVITYHFTPPHLRGFPAPPGAARILVLGDSFTEGELLNENETYVGRLQRLLDGQFGAGKVALLNAGTGGSGTADQLAFLEDFGEAAAPKAVIDVVSIDDFGRAQRSSLYRLAAPNGSGVIAGTVPRHRVLDAVITSRLYNYLSEHSELVQLVRAAARKLAPTLANPNVARLEVPEKRVAEDNPDGSFPVVTDEQRRLARALFRRMKKWCDLHAVQFAVINNGWRRYGWLDNALRSDGIESFDASPQVQSAIHGDPRSFIIPGNGHPNARGAEVTALAMWPFLQKFVVDSRLAPPGRLAEGSR
jgi:lysophospholipase L1-like esterase